MNTYKFFTLATLLALALGSVVMAQNVAINHGIAQKGLGNTITEAVNDASSKGYQIQDGTQIAIGGNVSETGVTDINRNSISVSGQTSTAPVVSGSNKRLFKSNNEDGGAEEKTLFLQNLVFKGNSTDNNNGGGAIWLSGDNFTITAKTITFQENTVTTAEKGGALSLSGETVFTGSDSKITFTGNKADGKANDIFATGSLTFEDTGTYSFDGGITGTAALNINTGAKISFLSGASNKVSSLSISGTDTKATFASGTETTVNGNTTIEGTSADSVTFSGTQKFNGTVEVTDANATFGGESTYGDKVTVSNSNATFNGTKQSFTDNVDVSNGSQVTMGGNTTAGGILTITDNTTHVDFEGTQKFTQILIQNWGKADVKAGTTFNSTPIVVDNRGELTIKNAFNTTTSSVQVNNGGVANLSSSSDFTFNGDLNVNGGTVNFTDNTTGKLTFTGSLSGTNGDLNLAIKKSGSTLYEGLTYYTVEGQTLEIKDSISGQDFIDVLASGFNYHDETTKFPFLTLESGATLTKDQFYQMFDLPFSWFASTSAQTLKDFEFKTEEWNFTGTVYLYKVDGDKVPEPSTWALLILGSAGLYFIRRKKTAKK